MAKDSIDYSTGDVLAMYGIILAVVLTILVVAFKSATKNKS
ncbi:MAG: hypothetical protein Q7U07_04870 [Gammaproteobacteria bacterium]|nr:hypothetical protein [Gammaproteobacteria bacterium]